MNYALARLIGFALDAIMALILLDVIGSWVLVMRVRLPDWAYTLLQTVHRAADLFLGPIRRFIPAIGGLDISPIIALVILNIVRGAVASLLL
jgi:YggT family protein